MTDTVLRKALCPLPSLMYHPEVLDRPHHTAAPYSPGNIMGWGPGIPARDHNLYRMYSNSSLPCTIASLRHSWVKSDFLGIIERYVRANCLFFVRSKLDINGAQGKVWRLSGEAKDR